MDRGFVVLPDQGRLLDLGVLADAEQRSGDLTVLQTQGEPPGFGPPLHRQELAAAEATGSATPSALDEIANRHHMEVLGPVPDSYL